MKDYYGILGVPPSASDLEIKRAFRKLAVRYHPDKNPSAEARPIFHDINEAYEVLGDSGKRALYDARRENPFAQILEEPVVRHRDPAYRRSGRRPPSKREPPASFTLMKEYLPHFMWASRIGLLTTVLFFIDYFIPYQHAEEKVVRTYAVRYQKQVSHYIVETDSGRKIKLYDFSAGYFSDDPTIRVTATRIYQTVMMVSNGAKDYEERVAYIYRTLVFFPILLFVISLLAHLYRHRIEFCFSLNLAGMVLLVINFVLI